MNIQQFHQSLSQLSRTRPIFHSEADFQHALACEIANTFPNYDIRLEYPINGQFIDIKLVDNRGDEYFIELKYKTQELQITYNNEQFNLKNQVAYDLGCYFFWKDISRLETLCLQSQNATGYALFLTNAANYWNPRRRNQQTNYDNFRIYNGRNVQAGQLNWRRVNQKYQNLNINKSYVLSWQQYTNIMPNSRQNVVFQYLLVQI